MAQKDLTVTKVTLKNEGTEDVGFRYFRVNFVDVIAPEDEVVLTAASSEEVAYYLALNDAKVGLTVTAEAASNAEDNG